jgi:hypothetical protein
MSPLGAEVVIALLHFGNEYEREPSTAQREISQELLARGVDVIIGSHPHVVQPIEHVLQYSERKVTDMYVCTRWAISFRLNAGAIRTVGWWPTFTWSGGGCAPM